MSEYSELLKLYYQQKNIESEFKKRFENVCAYRTELFINPILRGERTQTEYELYCLPINDISLLQEQIFSNSKKIFELSQMLPQIAKQSCIREIMINEIIKSNGIEGVHTTKKDIYNSMMSPKTTRLSGIIKKYEQIINGNVEKIESPEEIRKIYDDIFEDDILKDSENRLDGKLFRKESVHINNGIENIHCGDTNEEIIIKHLKDLIKFMNQKNINTLIKGCITHYYFEYIHPFYDGNGRFGRLIFSMYLARKLDIFTGLSLSYSIFKEKEKYSKLFSKVSNPKNYGEITFFIKGMLEIIEKGQKSIISMLKDKILKLEYAEKYIENLKLEDIESKILYIYMQDFIFSEMPHLKDTQLLEVLSDTMRSRITLNKYLNSLKEKGHIERYGKNPSSHILSEKIKQELS